MLVHSSLSNKSENMGGNSGAMSKKKRKMRGTESPVSKSAGDVSPPVVTPLAWRT